MDTSTSPAAICNRALMAIGSDAELSDPDLQEGTPAARSCLRAYGPVVRQMLRAAHWNFARREAQLTLLQDATGQTAGFSTTPGTPGYIGTGSPGMGPWVYEYAWPTDGLKARYVPARPATTNTAPPGNITLPATPLATNLSASSPFMRPVPARFLISQDTVPVQVGVPASWEGQPNFGQGQSPSEQTVILTNVQNATLVYTALILYPNVWDPLFQEAVVAAIGERIAMQVLADKRLALAVRGEQIKVAQRVLDAARVSDGNEGWTSNDLMPDWLRIRSGGGGRSSTIGPWVADGMMWCGWDSYGFSNGSAF